MAEALPPPPECGVESGRSSPSPAASPEFEFWMVGKNPSSFPSPALLTADELFSGGVVLPLHTLQASPSPADGETAEDGQDTDSAEEAQPPLAESSGIAPTPDLPAVTFKWKDIFKANSNGGGGAEGKERKKTERRVSSVSGNAELININIWPFSRSRSAGHSAAASSLTSGSRAKPNPAATNSNSSSGGTNANGVTANNASAPPAAAGAPAPPAPRKVSSAPCSRSNSRGESGPEPAAAIPAVVVEAAAAGGQAGPTSMLRRLVPGHGRTNTGGGAGSGAAATGIRVGRPSPVWQLRRNKLQQAAAEQKQASSSARKKAAAAAAAPAPAPAGDDSNAAASVSVGCRNTAEGGVEEGPNPPQGLFGLRTFFSKKVY